MVTCRAAELTEDERIALAKNRRTLEKRESVEEWLHLYVIRMANVFDVLVYGTTAEIAEAERAEGAVATGLEAVTGRPTVLSDDAKSLLSRFGIPEAAVGLLLRAEVAAYLAHLPHANFSAKEDVKKVGPLLNAPHVMRFMINFVRGRKAVLKSGMWTYSWMMKNLLGVSGGVSSVLFRSDV